jgi:lipoprotein NlpI
MEQLEKEAPVLLCKLEKIFPPGFFNPMQHLFIHLPYEAKVGGPVQYRWMFHIERAFKKLRAMVGNKARVEGCIAEQFKLKEVAHFMGHAERVFQNNAKKLVKDAIYYARIQATNLYFQKHPEEAGLLNKKEGSSKIYLTEDQYREVSIQFVLPFILIVVIDIICNIVCAGDGSMDGARA